MARKQTQETVGMIAVLFVILIPVGIWLYATFGNTSTPSAQDAGQQTTPTTSSTNSPQDISTARISLDDASSLPTSVPASQFIPFSFSIENTGDVGGQVPFKVSVKWSTGEDDVIDENVVTLAAGASTTIQEELKFEIPTETAEVSLELPQTGQTVQFSLPKAQ